MPEPERERSSKSSEVSRLIEPALVIGLITAAITAVIYLTTYRAHSILSARMPLLPNEISLPESLSIGYRLANVAFFIVIGVIAIKCALIFRKKYEDSKNPRMICGLSIKDPWMVLWLSIMVLIGLLKFFSTPKLSEILIGSRTDSIFPIVVLISTILVISIAFGCYTPRISRWVRKWRRIIKFCVIFSFLLFLYFYPVWVADEMSQKISEGTGGLKVILVPINNGTSLIPSVPNNEFYLISYQNNKYYVKDWHSLSQENSNMFVIKDSEVKYAQSNLSG